jgi:hypothetical protein
MLVMGRESEIPMIAQAERDRSNEEAFWELLSSRHQARCGRLPEGLLATPLARIDWSKAQNQLQEIARASGGRAYENMIDLSATYDDRMENLKSAVCDY